jgi:hypothetical protein
MVRFDAIVKVAAGSVLDDASAVELRLFDDQGALVEVHVGMDAGRPRIVGPAWQRLHGRLVEVATTVTQAEVTLPGIAASPRTRRDGPTGPVTLVPLGAQVGVEGEPHVWWRFDNRSAAPVPILDILRDQTLWLDGASYRAPQRHYDGPHLLQPDRSFLGVWSLDDFEPLARRGAHRLELEILGLRSPAVDVEWRDLGAADTTAPSE